MPQQRIIQLIREVLPAVTAIRHALHRQPEPAHQEFQSAALVREHLVPLDPEIFPPFLKTDVVALLRGHLRDSLWGSVGFVFQPGEEIVAGDLHSPYYDFNDDAPAQGIHFLTAMTLDLLAPGP